MGRRSGRDARGTRHLIAVDSSAWIGHLRNAPDDAVRRLRGLFGREPLVVGDIVLLEVLQGARDDGHARQLEQFLRQFVVLPMLDDSVACQAAANYRLLRSRGMTVRKTVDLVIGTWRIRHGIALLHDDRDFDPMQALGLRVA